MKLTSEKSFIRLGRLGFRGALSAVLLGTLLAACQGAPAPKPSPLETEINAIVTGGKLINEGGPVFALPGTVRLPSYFNGDLSKLVVRAERLDGGAYLPIAMAKVESDGSFVLHGPIKSTLFFASTEFTAKDSVHRLRALFRAEPGAPIILDSATSLMASKVALAAQRRNLDDLNYNDARDLSSSVRSRFDTALGQISLDQPNEQLSRQLSDLVATDPTLSARLLRWEASLIPTYLPSPAVLSSSSPTPTPSPVSSFMPR